MLGSPGLYPPTGPGVPLDHTLPRAHPFLDHILLLSVTEAGAGFCFTGGWTQKTREAGVVARWAGNLIILMCGPESLGSANAQVVEMTRLGLIQTPHCKAACWQMFTVLNLGALIHESGPKLPILGVG